MGHIVADIRFPTMESYIYWIHWKLYMNWNSSGFVCVLVEQCVCSDSLWMANMALLMTTMKPTFVMSHVVIICCRCALNYQSICMDGLFHLYSMFKPSFPFIALDSFKSDGNCAWDLFWSQFRSYFCSMVFNTKGTAQVFTWPRKITRFEGASTPPLDHFGYGYLVCSVWFRNPPCLL